MRNSEKFAWATAAALAVALGGMSYTFLIHGNVEPHADGRTAVLLLPDERNLVLSEMRGLLEGVQAIVQASVAGDMQSVATTATSVGMIAAQGESPQLISKLPLEFKTLGLGTHADFDELAQLAGVTDDPLEVLSSLGKIMDKCVTCHAGYRLGIEGADLEQ